MWFQSTNQKQIFVEGYKTFVFVFKQVAPWQRRQILSSAKVSRNAVCECDRHLTVIKEWEAGSWKCLKWAGT